MSDNQGGVETLTGITKSISVLRKEGLPGRSSIITGNIEDVEHLKDTNFHRDFSVAQIFTSWQTILRGAAVLEARAGQIQKEVKGAGARQVCLRSGIQGGGLIHWTRSCWNETGMEKKGYHEKDRIDRLYKARDMAYYFVSVHCIHDYVH